MATVDLDKLSAELNASGYKAWVTHSDNGQGSRVIAVPELECLASITINPNCISVSDDDAGFIDLEVLQTIVRHLAPVAPDPGLREAIRGSIESVEHSKLVDLGYVDAIADAVLAVLAERGVR